jgi:hypothetical protein
MIFRKIKLTVLLFSFTGCPYLCAMEEKFKEPVKFAYKTFGEWYSACSELPYYHITKQNYSNKPDNLTIEEIEKAIYSYQEVMKTALSNKNKWVNKKHPQENFFENPIFFPFAQKIELEPGSKISFHGDLHGDIHSLLKYLQELKSQGYINNNFEIIPNNFYMVFLGDYVDRGNFGIEVIYTILRLKIANPDKIILVRGNHEDYDINVKLGFAEEIQKKFNTSTNVFLKRSIAKIYEFMPVVLYLGTNTDFLQCNHGGMETGYLPIELLDNPSPISYECIETLKRKSNWQNHIKKFHSNNTQELFELQLLSSNDIPAKNAPCIGFLWNDFLINPEKQLEIIPNRGYSFGKKLTYATLRASATPTKKVIGVFRAHQHDINGSDMMTLILKGATPGVGKLWNAKKWGLQTIWPGIVATFNVSPDSIYGMNLKFNYDTYGILKLGKNFPQDWDLEVKNITVFE